MAKRKKAAKKKPVPEAATGRLGAAAWLAVRQKSGAGPMEPKTRRGTRTEHEREAIEGEDVPLRGDD